MYLDVVLDADYQPIQKSNLVEEELVDWLKDHPEVNVQGNMVCVGRTLEFLSVQEYIDRHTRLASRVDFFDIDPS
jgi:hypothetical protein